MTRIVTLCAITVGMLSALLAQPAALYTDEELADALKTYSANLRGMWRDDFVARLAVDERTFGKQLRLEMPLFGRNRQPFEYYAEGDVVTVPIASVKFLDDISIAYAWYESRGCDVRAIADYAGLLRMRGAAAGVSMKAPRAALGVPGNVLQDAYVNDVSGKLLKSAIYFLMAHEFSHLRSKHRFDDSVPLDRAQRQEIEADAFALDVMRRIAVIPAGMVPFFLTLTWLETTSADHPTPAAYAAAIRVQGKHPISSARLTTLGRSIRDGAQTFAAGQASPEAWRPTMERIGTQIESMGSTLDDRVFRQDQEKRIRRISPIALASSCR